MSAVEQKWSFVAWLIPLTSFPFIAWTWKAIMWDKIIENGLTSTPALTGALAAAYPIIIGGLFLHAWIKS